MTKRPIVGSYCYTGKDLKTSHENLDEKSPNTEFDTPRHTLRGAPAVRLDTADEIAERVRQAKKDGGIITDLEEGKRHLTDTYPAVGNLLVDLERIHRGIEAEKQRLAAKKVLAKISPVTQKPVSPQNHKPTHPKETVCEETPKNTRNLDDIIHDYLGNGDSDEVDADIKLEDLKAEVVTAPEIETAKKSQREDSTLVLPAMDENGVINPIRAKKIEAILEFAEKFEDKTGPIVLKQEVMNRIENIVAELRKMDEKERQEKFPKFPPSVRKQILKLLSINAAELKANSQQEWPPITMTVTLGNDKVHAEIRLADKKM